MLKPAAIVGQVILYGAFAAFIGYFATSPKYRQIPDDVALIKLSISHLGDRECRKRTPEELQKLPPNMRAPMDCPRERSDINLEVDIDGQPAWTPLGERLRYVRAVLTPEYGDKFALPGLPRGLSFLHYAIRPVRLAGRHGPRLIGRMR